MAYDSSLIDWIDEALAGGGQITSRKMFGGLALYIDGRIFAMVDGMGDNLLWFKSDAESDAIWDAEGCERFTFDFGDGKMAGSMNCRRAPDDVYDDVDAMRRWAHVAIAAAMRAPVKKSRPKKAAR